MAGRIKSSPSDFIVQEALGFGFDGQGEHLYIHVRKCALNTNDVIENLQIQFQCRSVDIGVSGLKDKHAITDQWFSVRTPKDLVDTDLRCVPQKPLSDESDSVSLTVPEGQFCVLESQRHSRKLRRGSHKHNRFIITVRDSESMSRGGSLSKTLDKRLQFIQDNGFANYFGPQRFGFDHQNVSAAERLFANPNRKISRSKRGLLISAARSQIFNSVCAERIKAGNWNVPLDGEPMLLNGTQSFFINHARSERIGAGLSDDCNDASLNDIVDRCQRHDIHPTGPLWGAGATLAMGECKQLETGILQLYTTLTKGLENTGLKQQRRALRANVGSLTWHWQNPSIVTLDFKLLKGVYATSFLSEFMIRL